MGQRRTKRDVPVSPIGRGDVGCSLNLGGVEVMGIQVGVVVLDFGTDRLAYVIHIFLVVKSASQSAIHFHKNTLYFSHA